MNPPPLLALPPRALWRVTGEDRLRYLNGQLTQDLARLAPGRAVYGAVLTGKGKIVGDLFVAAADDALYLDADLGLRDALRERLEKFLIADDAEFEDVTGKYVLRHQLGDHREAVGPLAFASARFGVPGRDLWLPEGEGASVSPEADALVQRLEIEHGIARWGFEIDAETLPQEVALDTDRRGLSYEKGCYVGQETVARVRSIGHVNRRLVRLEQVAGPGEGPLPAVLRAGEEEAGKLTRTARFPDGRILGLGFLKRKFLEAPPQLEADGRDFRVTGVC